MILFREKQYFDQNFPFFLTVQIHNGQHQEQPGLHTARPVLARRRAGRVRRAGVGRRGAAHV